MVVYRPPGVKVIEKTNPNLINNLGNFNVTAIVAEGSSTVPVRNISLIKADSDYDTIKDINGDDLTSGKVDSIIGVGDFPGYYNYVQGTDYELDTGYRIHWISENRPATGSTFYITYNRIKETADYDPINFFDLDDVRDQYGSELTSGVINPMSAAALLELEGRGEAGGIICVQVVDGSTSSFINAIDKLEEKELDTIICTGVTNTEVRQYLIQHCNKMSSETLGKERTCFIAPTTTTETVANIGTLAEGIDNSRVALIAPPRIGLILEDSITGESTRLSISSIYAGANISGIESNQDNDVATSMLRKQLSTRIDLDDDIYNRAEKNYLGSKGVFILEQNPTTGIVSVFDALTTDTTTVDKVERNVRRAVDRLRKDLRKYLNDLYIGQKNIPATVSSVAMSTKVILENYKNATLIEDYRNVNAKKGSDPREILVSAEILPVFAVKFITITLTITGV